MQDADKGQVIVPTGGGKTIIMIEHAKRLMDAAERPLTFVVVAPRILLANQLCDEFLAFPGVVRPGPCSCSRSQWRDKAFQHH